MSDKKKDKKKKKRRVDSLGTGMAEFARKLIAGRSMKINSVVDGTTDNNKRY